MKKVKKNVKDFTTADLPVNRKELFFDILKTQWNSLLIIAFIIINDIKSDMKRWC